MAKKTTLEYPDGRREANGVRARVPKINGRQVKGITEGRRTEIRDGKYIGMRRGGGRLYLLGLGDL